MAETPAVRLEGVTFGYRPGDPVLVDLDLTVERGDFMALIGPNGGGKTTLVRMVLGFLEPWSGSVRVLGGSPRRARERMGYVPQLQSAESFPVTALDVVLMGRLRESGLLGPYGAADREAAMAALEEMGMQRSAHRPMEVLSGGQRQRVMIARALVGRPELLLLDEPVASVDTETEESFFNRLAELNESMTIVLVTHDIGAVSSWVKTIACLNRRLYSHAETLERGAVERAYGCPFELVTHGVPHRVIGERSD